MRRISKIFIATIFFFGAFAHSYAQVPEDRLPKLKEIKGKKLLEEITPMKDEKDGLWGYVNPEGKYTIKPVFTGACPYEGHIARVSVENQWGLINDKGLFSVWPRYQSIDRFSVPDSIAVAQLDGKFGLISTRGGWVLNFDYDEIGYADYGYLARAGGLYCTIDHQGKVILEPQFEEVRMLDKARGLEHIRKDGRWGVLRDGKDILTVKWDEPIKFLRNAGEGKPDLYIARQGGKTGVVTIYGQYVVPAVYDSIELSETGDYYITRQDGRYGALSLKMVELIPPIMKDKPFMGEDIYPVCDDGTFYCANIHGTVEFDKAADLYYIFKPDEYVTTKYFPKWAKTHVIEENLLARQDLLDKSRLVSERMLSYDFNTEEASMNSSIPRDVELSFPSDWDEKYGITLRGDFARSSGTVSDQTDAGEKTFNVLYKAPGSFGGSMYLVNDPSAGDCLIRLDDSNISLKETFTKFDVKKFNGMYPRDYARVSDAEIMVRFAFVRPAGELSTSIIETNPYMLPVEPFDIKVHTGAANSKAETHAVVVFNLDSLKAVSFTELLPGGDNRICVSKFGGFYTLPSSSVMADQKSALRKYDRNGVLDWEFYGTFGEEFYDLEETENYIYLCGSNKSSGVEIPVVAQLSKRGEKVQSYSKDYQNARFTGIICDNYLLYMKTSFVKGPAPMGKEYYPLFVLEDMGDNVGVWFKCVWENWDTGVIGGMGLVDDKGTWLQTPALYPDQLSTAFDWEFSGFAGEYLVVRHMSRYGLIDREGNMKVDTKYELIEPLLNPSYFRAQSDGLFGVIDENGNVIVPFEYEYVGHMNEDVIVVRKDGKYGCLDKEGKQIVEIKFDEIREYVGGRARALYDGLFGFIDKQGSFLVRPFYDEVENFSEGCALVTVQGNLGFVNLEGKWIANLIYQAGGNFSGGLAPLAQNGKWGYVDNTGSFVIPMQFSDAKEFDARSGLACVAQNGKWGVINKTGAVVLPMEYDLVEICSDGYFYVEKDGKCGICSHRGKEIYPPVCESIERSKSGRIFKCGVAYGRLDGQRVRIDSQGNTVYQLSLITE